MTPWQRTGIAQLAERAGDRHGPRVGIIDGPVDTSHPVLEHARIDSADPGGPSCTNPDSLACRHGTFVAGQIVGLGPSAELVTHSLFCEAERLEACAAVRPRHLADAITRLLDRRVRIINMSVGLQGGPAGSMSALHRAYRRAREQGTLLVAAAGNDAQLDANPLFRDPWVIPVAAHDGEGTILPTSNRGGMVASRGLLAPGHELPGLAPGGGWTRMSGTSVAAPLVTAGAGLLWSLLPQASAEQIHRALLRPDVERGASIPPLLDLIESERWLAEQFSTRPTPSRSPMNDPTLSVAASPSVQASPARPPDARPPAAPLSPTSGLVVPQACDCAPGPAAGFAFSTGQLQPRFPNEGVRKEFDKRARQLDVPNDDFQAVLSKFPYLARQMCWVLRVNEQPSGILIPVSESQREELIDALGLNSRFDPELLVTGTLGSTAPPSKCDGLQVPMVAIAELDFFTQQALRERLQAEVDLPQGATKSDLDDAIQRIWIQTGVFRQPGFDDEQRAKNFLTLRTTSIYTQTVLLSLPSQGGFWLQAITAVSTEAETGRSVVNVDFHYRNSPNQRQTWRAEVDVTDLFAFQLRAMFEV